MSNVTDSKENWQPDALARRVVEFLAHASGYKVKRLHASGFKINGLHASGYKVKRLHASGYKVKRLHASGYKVNGSEHCLGIGFFRIDRVFHQ
jgi:biotin operon repressor